MKIKLNPITDKLPHRHAKVFLPPESLVYTGLLHEEIKIDVIQYDIDSYTENIITKVDDLKQFNFKNKTTWIQIYGLHDESVVKKIGDLFNIHNLVLEDILNIYQRPKLEDYDNYLFLVVKAFFSCFPHCNTLKIFTNNSVEFSLLFIHVEKFGFCLL